MLKINLPKPPAVDVELRKAMAIDLAEKPTAVPKSIAHRASLVLLLTAHQMGREMRLRQIIQAEAAQWEKTLRGKPAISREQAKAAKRVALVAWKAKKYLS